ncbi:hypothetical protein PMI40_02066, partial [Herbaspirillum sp. YR522]
MDGAPASNWPIMAWVAAAAASG